MRSPVSPVFAFAVAAAGIATFSCMDAVMKRQSIEIGAYNAMLWRAIVGLGMSAPLYLASKPRWPERALLIVHVKRSIAAGISVLLFFWGLVRVAMAEGVALCFLAPVFAILLAAPMLGERVRRGALGGCAVAFVGLIVIAIGKATDANAGPEALPGAGAIVVASLFYGYNLVLLRKSAQVAGPIEITFFTNLIFTALYAVGVPWLAIVPAAGHLPWLALAAALAIASSMLLAWAYAHAEAQTLVPVEYTAFVWSAILGAIVFGERVLLATVAGATLIIAGCFIAARGRKLAGPVIEAAA